MMDVNDLQVQPKPVRGSASKKTIIWDILFLIVLVIGAYFRLVGVNWGDNSHLHPDERFLTMVETSISPVDSLRQYFDTSSSSLNPNNRGYGFYVYGTLPLFIVRYVGEWLAKTGYDQIDLVGRVLSGLFDLGVVYLVYLAAFHLYRKKPLALVAAFFVACSVLPIQLSHYFTVDTFANFFAFLTFYFAVRILTDERLVPVGLAADRIEVESDEGEILDWSTLWKHWETIPLYLLFGIALGMAVASKVSTFPLAILLPAAVLVRYIQLTKPLQRAMVFVFVRNLILAAMFSLLVFRICQPFAFSGPGFFGVGLNENWVANLKELAVQSKGDVDFPPALQWARRPITFALTNMVEWGLGLPLGILAWAGFLWMAWKMFKGEWTKHILIWGWTALYFAWQSINFTRSMRYQLPVYPTLAIIAAWVLFEFWEKKSDIQQNVKGFFRRHGKRILVGLIGIFVITSTTAWAFAFTRIYTKPLTRIAASTWIYQNVPAAINLQIVTPDGTVNQPLGFTLGRSAAFEQPIVMTYQPKEAGSLAEINFNHIVNRGASANPSDNLFNLNVVISDNQETLEPLTSAVLTDNFNSDGGDFRGRSFNLKFDNPIDLAPDKIYYIVFNAVDEGSELAFSGPITLGISTPDGMIQKALPEPVETIRAGTNYQFSFQALKTGTLSEIYLPHAVDWGAQPGQKELRLTISDPVNPDQPLASSSITSDFLAPGDVRGESYTFELAPSIQLVEKQTYYATIELAQGPGEIGLYGSKQADESSWDDPLPRDINGFSPFDYSNGVYRTELNFEMYWDDNQEKLDRFLTTIDQADYIFISSNRQWGTTVRVPERYPLTTLYYRNLVGCPVDKEITWCYSVAEPGMFKGTLGFDLVEVFQSEPTIGNWQINTQFAEEAFTVYDHPKVLIFKKTPEYSLHQVQSLLSSVDLTKVVHLTPRQATKSAGNLMLPEERLAQQQAGGTWSDLFNRDVLFNQYPFLAAILWYLVIAVLGWICYPLVRIVFRGLDDRGYPLARLVGMLLLAYLVWLAGSAGIPIQKITITIVFGCLLILNGALYWIQRHSIQAEFKERWRYYLMVEGVILGLFLIFLFIRLGNPDLWHPAKGGEKPMDFSYFNAVIKSTTFPPFDPWFAGGYLNYYYFGFVLTGVPVKWLGIMPSIGYNLILPTMFSLLGIGAFCFGWNVLSAIRKGNTWNGNRLKSWLFEPQLAISGLTSTVFLLIMGNLGTVRMIWHGFQKLAAPGGEIEGAGFFTRWGWTFNGIAQFFNGAKLPYGAGDWYWIPSRALPSSTGDPITEFPFFTFLYADPHAHLFALPLTVLILCWVLSIVRGGWKWEEIDHVKPWLQTALSLLVGALIIGSLRPTNTWDLPTYLILSVIAVAYIVIRSRAAIPRLKLNLSENVRRAIYAVLIVIGLVGLSVMLFQPFAAWYGQGYTKAGLWNGDHTPMWSYLTHWGLFIFIILSWLVWETYDWMASTPVSALEKLRPYRGLLRGLFILLPLLVIGLLLLGVGIAWLVLPMAAWAAVLIFRPGQPDVKRLIFFMVGTALLLTLVVEMVVLEGDIGRMNTVFKFYLQAWTLLSLSAAVMVIWLIPVVMERWRSFIRSTWMIGLSLLVGGAALFPILGGADKIRDRMTQLAPHTLDGMAYMKYATYYDFGKDMILSQDYEAIQWMQDNIQGSPVIVEANVTEYRWGSRFTIYTGLPGVVGWNWHQRQQRAIVPSNWVTDRVDAVGNFYNSTSREEAESFLNLYNVSYVVVGQLERQEYTPEGIGKFVALEGDLWEVVYQKDDTTIYKVLH
jgi:YYY domain-containing protein